MAEELERWFAVADNRGEWERLRRALALEQGFALLIVDVPDVGTETRVVELLAGEQEFVQLDARESDARAPVRELLQRRGERVVLRSVEASRSDIEALERCLVQLNMRRDQIVAHEHVLVIVLRRDAVARMIDVAPDLYSVHRARFRFARLVQPRPAPAWLLRDTEFAAVLDDDGRPLEERLKHYEWRFLVLEPIVWPSDGHMQTLVQTPARAGIVARIFARHEGVRCLAWPQPLDLAQALAAPTLDLADILRGSLRHTQTTGTSRLAYMCGSALAWMHLQRSELVEARAALDEAVMHLHGASLDMETRHQLLALQIGAAEGLLEPYSRSPLEGWIPKRHKPHDDTVIGAIGLSLAELECDLWPHTTAMNSLRLALDRGLDLLPFNRWRLDGSLRSLPAALVEAAVPEHDRVEAIAWLGRKSVGDLALSSISTTAAPFRSALFWGEIWSKHLMIERAIGHAERVAQLVALGLEFLATGSYAYEVWRPLVEMHAQLHDASTLEQLLRMPLTYERRFGQRFAAALHIIADLVDRGIVELLAAERDELRARAATREGMPPALRLGWWAIELALDAER